MVSTINYCTYLFANQLIEPGYPRNLYQLADFIHQHSWFLFMHNHADLEVPNNPDPLPIFEGDIKVYHSALAVYYVPSDLCGAEGLPQERICSTPSFFRHERCYTVFAALDEAKKGMEGMEVGHVFLFFSFHYHRKSFSCALINWFLHGDEPDRDTGIRAIWLKHDGRGRPMVEVIDIDSIT